MEKFDCKKGKELIIGAWACGTDDGTDFVCRKTLEEFLKEVKFDILLKIKDTVDEEIDTRGKKYEV